MDSIESDRTKTLRPNLYEPIADGLIPITLLYPSTIAEIGPGTIRGAIPWYVPDSISHAATALILQLHVAGPLAPILKRHAAAGGALQPVQVIVNCGRGSTLLDSGLHSQTSALVKLETRRLYIVPTYKQPLAPVEILLMGWLQRVEDYDYIDN